MAVRIKDGIIPYTGGIGIEITDNHVINVLLREMNNLIHVNEDRELYVDLQLDNGIRPDDDFPVGVTTGKILEEDGWQQNGLILNWKTTSGDYNRLIYANDGNLYIDLGDGVWRLFGGGGGGGGILECNTKTFYVTKEVVDPDTGTTSIVVDMEQLQDAVDWYFDGKNPILWYQDGMYVFERESSSSQVLYFVSTHLSQVRFESRGTAFTDSDRVVVYVDADTKQITGVHQDVATLSNNPSFIPANYTLRDPFMATQPSHPISLAYLNQQLALKQNILVPGQNITIDPNTNEISAVDTTYTAGTRITIDQNNVISADISGVMTYMGNVTDPSQLPASGNQGDCWYSESDGHLYSWNGTQWNDIGGVTPSMTQFFNKTTDDSDDIHEGNTNLFVSPNEKNTWNAKQDQIIAGNNITINPDGKTINATDTTYSAGTGISIDQNNEISADPYVGGNGITVSGNTITNDAPFEPENIGTMGQYLKKRNDGKYEWANVPQGGSGTSYSAGDGINIDSNNEISNTKPFNPINNGQMGQVLTKSADGYYWKTPQGGGGAEYTAGYGLNLNGNEFSVDTSDIATQSDLSNKQDTISDLSDIRNDAQEGASAYTTIQNYGDIVTHNASEFATSAQGGKADTALQPGDNITELVNNAGYITGISSSDVTGALGYTPYDSLNPSGYITGISSGDVTSALGYTPYDSSNPSGYISGITSGDVTTALGYTPYDSSNPSGYTTNTGDVVGPSSSTNGHLAVFDGTTGKLIKDGGAVPTVPSNVSAFNNDSGYLTSSTGVTSVNGSTGAVTIKEPTSSSTAPSSPSAGDLWYNTTTHVMNVYNGSSWDTLLNMTDSNTKIFSFYWGGSDAIQRCQELYDWIYSGGYAFYYQPTLAAERRIFSPTNITTGTIDSDRKEEIQMGDGLINKKIVVNTITVNNGVVTSNTGGATYTDGGYYVKDSTSFPSVQTPGQLWCPQQTTNLMIYNGSYWENICKEDTYGQYTAKYVRYFDFVTGSNLDAQAIVDYFLNENKLPFVWNRTNTDLGLLSFEGFTSGSKMTFKGLTVTVYGYMCDMRLNIYLDASNQVTSTSIDRFPVSPLVWDFSSTTPTIQSPTDYGQLAYDSSTDTLKLYTPNGWKTITMS